MSQSSWEHFCVVSGGSEFKSLSWLEISHVFLSLAGKIPGIVRQMGRLPLAPFLILSNSLFTNHSLINFFITYWIYKKLHFLFFSASTQQHRKHTFRHYTLTSVPKLLNCVLYEFVYCNISQMHLTFHSQYIRYFVMINIILVNILKLEWKFYIKWMSRDVYKGVYNKVNQYKKVKQWNDISLKS
jgi:hypothetical protein